MTKYLIRTLTKDAELTDTAARTRICLASGILGIVCNLFLFGVKLVVGTMMNSIAIISDAFNNLSDTGSSLVTIIGAKLSRKKPDREHPFGHGRYEYISSLIVSFIIIMVGIELFKGSVQKVLHPESVVLSPWLLGFLCLSVPVKLWMFSYNRTMGKAINSTVVLAASQDSINDAVASSAVIIAAVVGRFVNFPPLDGIVGTVVSLMIIYSGFGITMDTIGLLLGSVPDPLLVEQIRKNVLETEGVVGTHDLIVHDYGPGRILASVHAEVPDNCDIVEIHEKIDSLEHRINDLLGVHIVVHMDPISVDCEYTTNTKIKVQKMVRSIDEKMNIHDFRIVDGTNNINLIFDVEVPADYGKIETLKEDIQEKVMQIDPRFNTVINIDIIYV